MTKGVMALICIAVVVVLGLILICRNKTSNQILLLGVELTVVGGIFIIGLDDVINGSINIGLILVIIGLLMSIQGFLKNDI